jgi:hypothetical protein
VCFEQAHLCTIFSIHIPFSPPFLSRAWWMSYVIFDPLHPLVPSPLPPPSLWSHPPFILKSHYWLYYCHHHFRSRFHILAKTHDVWLFELASSSTNWWYLNQVIFWKWHNFIIIYGWMILHGIHMYIYIYIWYMYIYIYGIYIYMVYVYIYIYGIYIYIWYIYIYIYDIFFIHFWATSLIPQLDYCKQCYCKCGCAAISLLC